MSSPYRARSDWTDVPRPVDNLVKLVTTNVDGFAVHWPGTGQDVIGDPGEKAIAARLESYRDYHTTPIKDGGKGWSDIAYQAAIDQAGRIWDCRGIAYQSAANGDLDVNRQYGAVLLMIGEKETPSAAMITAVQRFRSERWLARFPGAKDVVGHRDVRPEPTACPGDRAYALIKNGTFTKPYQEDDLTVTDAQWDSLVAKVDRITERIKDLPHATWDDDYIPNAELAGDYGDNQNTRAKFALSDTRNRVIDIQQFSVRAEAAIVGLHNDARHIKVVGDDTRSDVVKIVQAVTTLATVLGECRAILDSIQAATGATPEQIQERAEAGARAALADATGTFALNVTDVGVMPATPGV